MHLKLYFLVLLLVASLVCCATLYGQSVRITSESAAKSETHVKALARAGEHWATELKEQEARLNRSFTDLNKAISLMQVDELNGTRLAIIEVREIVRKLRTQVDGVVADHRAVLAASKSYDESLQRIRPLLTTAAGTLAVYARDEPYESLREDYLLWADIFDAIAVKYYHKSVQVKPAVKAVADNLAYVKRTALMLERLERLLAIPPDDGTDTEIFLRRLASYVQSFERFRQQLRKLHSAVTGDAPKQVQPAQKTSSRKDKSAAYRFPAEPSRRSNLIKAHFVSQSLSAVRPAASDYALEVLVEERFFEKMPARRSAELHSETERTRSHQMTRDRSSSTSGVDTPGGQFVSPAARPGSEPLLRPAATEILPFLGDWKVSPGNVTIRLESGGGDRVTASLVRSPAILSASGEFRLEGNELVAMDYRYRLATGDWLDLSGTRFRLTGHRRLAAVGPKYTRNSSGGFERLYRSSHRYTLTQTTDAIRPAYYQALKY